MNAMPREFYNQLDQLDGMERELYRILDYFTADRERVTCTPSIKSIATKFKRARNTTKAYLRKLETKGFIRIQERKAVGKITNNKYNQTNEYTLLLKQFNKAVLPKTDFKKSKPIVCAESDIDIVVRELTTAHSKDVVSSALKTMRKNMRNGSIIRSMKSYLEALINKASGQLNDIEQAIGSLKGDSTDTKSGNIASKGAYKANQNKVNTKFHNFEQRTSKYSPEELERKVLANTKRK